MSLGGPDLFRIIKLVAAPKSPKEYAYFELLKALNNYFEPKRNTIGERFIFHRRQQKADESVCDYIVELKSLSQTCNFGDNLEETLRDKLISGVYNTKIQRRLLNEKELTFDKACEIARTMEATEDNLSEMQNGEQVAAFGRFKKKNKYEKDSKSVFSRLGGKDKEQKPKRFETYTFFLCNKMGHVVKQCFKNPNRVAKKNGNNGVRMNEEEIESEDNGNSAINHINSVLANSPMLCGVSINLVKIYMEMDTGACKTVMHVDDFSRHFSNIKLNRCNRKLFSVSGQLLDIYGTSQLQVKFFEDKSKIHTCEFIVVNSSRKFLPLLVRNWLDILYPDWRMKFKINAINVEEKNSRDINVVVEKLKKDFSSVFSNIAASTIKHFKAKLNLVGDVKPIFFKPYTVPYAVENEIKKLCDNGIIAHGRHQLLLLTNRTVRYECVSTVRRQ